MNPPIRVLVVDDSVVIRRLLTTIIEKDPDLEVAGVAQNGRIALQRIEQLEPDIVTLDVEMPELDGLGTLELLRKDNPRLPVVMFSTLTARGATATLDALSLGASDYVTKPANVGSVNEAMDRVRAELVPKLKALVPRGMTAVAAPPAPPKPRSVTPSGTTEIVAIGSSTGGPNALATVIAALPGDLAVPVVIAQHMPAVFTAFLAERLDGHSPLTVRECEPGMMLTAGHVYVAPGDYHMRVRRRAGRRVELLVDQEEQVHFCRPSVDVLFQSVADTFAGNVLAVILTGMGSDGRDGCKVLRDKGAHIMVQDEASSVVWGMPGAVASAGLADDILPLYKIAPSIAQYVSANAPLVQRTA